MKRIESFCVNHDKLTPGMYLSRIDGDAVTYDVRMVTPNAGVYLENGRLHTFEHLFAILCAQYRRFGQHPLRRSDGLPHRILLHHTDKISKARAIELVQETCAFIEHFEGEIPGSSRIECGNYLDHSLPKAKQYAHDLAKTLAGWTEEKMVYQL